MQFNAKARVALLSVARGEEAIHHRRPSTVCLLYMCCDRRRDVKDRRYLFDSH